MVSLRWEGASLAHRDMNDITTPTPQPQTQPPPPGGFEGPEKDWRFTKWMAIAALVVAFCAWIFPFEPRAKSPVPNPLGEEIPEKPVASGPGVPPPQEETPGPSDWPPEPGLRPPTPSPVRTSAQDSGPAPTTRPPVYSPPRGTNGRDEEPAGVREPSPSPTAPVEEPQEPPAVPSPREPEVEAPSKPEVTVGEQIDVFVEALQEPQGARPLTPLRYPPVPADALRSRLSSEQMVCVVAVEPDGEASADCDGNPPDLPRFLLQQAKRMLEEARWQPATDEYGDPRPGRVEVRFTWR